MKNFRWIMIALSALLSAACTAQTDKPNSDNQEDKIQNIEENKSIDLEPT